MHGGEATFEAIDLRALQAAPLAAAQRLQQAALFGFIEDRPCRERARANGRAAVHRKCACA
jgi:hypothetical protein